MKLLGHFCICFIFCALFACTSDDPVTSEEDTVTPEDDPIEEEDPITTENDSVDYKILMEDMPIGSVSVDINEDGENDLWIYYEYLSSAYWTVTNLTFENPNNELEFLRYTEPNLKYIQVDTVTVLDTIQPFIRNDIYTLTSCDSIFGDNVTIETNQTGRIKWVDEMPQDFEIPEGTWHHSFYIMNLSIIRRSDPPHDKFAQFQDEFTIKHYEYITDCNTLKRDQTGFFFFRLNETYCRAEIRMDSEGSLYLVEFIVF